MLYGIFMNHFRDLHIEATVLSDLHDFPLPPPSNGIQAVTGFADTESGLGDGVQREPVTGGFFHDLQQVEGGKVVRKVEKVYPISTS